MANFNEKINAFFEELRREFSKSEDKTSSDTGGYENMYDYDDLNRGKKFKGKFRAFADASLRTLRIIGSIFLVLYYLILLPPINLHSKDFWLFALLILIALKIMRVGGKKAQKTYTRIIMLGLVLFVILSLTSLELFNAKRYANMIQVEDGNFQEDIDQLPVSKIPTVDRDSASRLGSRKMGELLDLVSQFDIDETYTQINYQDKPVRVTPLKYNGFLKYLFNFREGIPGYMMIDIINGESDLVELEDKIKYSKGDYLFRNIYRYARLRYPFDIMGQAQFEVDDQGIPHWIIASYKNRVGWFGGMDVKSVIIINAVNGDHEKYDISEVPQWVDRVYNPDYIIRQLDWYGAYQLGFINSRFAQKKVLTTTEGYNYLALDDDVYLYTGFTSVAGDESNVGFILSNLRTKETKFYPVSSAKEYSAMESAEGAVQEKNYQSTFPILLNIEGKPTYFLSLKDNAGLIKQYAFVDALDYQNVSIGTTVHEALAKHKSSSLPIDDEPEEPSQVLKAKGKIEDIHSVVIDGNSHYYFSLEEDDKIYISSIGISEELPFLQAGDQVEFEYYEKNINEVINFLDIKR